MLMLAGLLGLVAVGAGALDLSRMFAADEDDGPAVDAPVIGDAAAGPGGTDAPPGDFIAGASSTEPDAVPAAPSPTAPPPTDPEAPGTVAGRTGTGAVDREAANGRTDSLSNGYGDDLGAGPSAGTVGDTTVRGGSGNDIVDGGDGDDQLFGAFGADTIAGGAGGDRLVGGGGDDRLDGGAGEDGLDGGDGDDTLNGGNDDDLDWLSGGSGADRLVLRANDAGAGGAGADSFVLAAGAPVAAPAGAAPAALVTDFDLAEDRIEILLPPGTDPADVAVGVLQDTDGSTLVTLDGLVVARLLGGGADLAPAAILLLRG